MKHTPTPWNSEKYQDSSQTNLVASSKSVASGAVRTLGKINKKEDAAFIVQAVNSHDELLNACKKFLEKWEEWNTCDDPGQVHLPIGAIRQAIAKAEGSIIQAPDDPETESYSDKAWDFPA